MKKEEKIKNKKESLEEYPIGPWHGGYAHYCPNCLRPIVLCTCVLPKK